MKTSILPPPLRRRSRAALTLVAAAVGAALVMSATARAADEAPAATSASALSLSWSAFGTLGYVHSNREWGYQRFIADEGTIKRDSVLGAQVDAQLSPQWSLTLQGRLAPSSRSDSEWDLTTAWAFAAWRPSNDWLVRAGKLRVPFLLRSEHMDVGQTYDELRLPAEVYGLTPTQDFTGAHVTRTWELDQGDLSVEAYHGGARLTRRSWNREGVPPRVAAGAQFREADTTVTGLVLTWRSDDLMARAGVHHARTRLADGGRFFRRPLWTELGPGLGFWKVSNEVPFGPPLDEVGDINNLLLTAGAEASLAGGWRMAAEVAHVEQRDIELGNETTAAYATVYRSWGALTPYATVAASVSRDPLRGWKRTLDSTTLGPGLSPMIAGALNGSMRLTADGLAVVEQTSFALGASYALTPTSKLKLEWLHARPRLSQLVDLPPGEPLDRRRSVDALSASVSVVF